MVDDHSAGWLARGFPWVYPKEVLRRPQRSAPGLVVALQDERGRSLGTGIWDDGWLAVRRFRSEGGPLDAAWMEASLRAALARRAGLIPPATDAWRAVHAENDELPGLRVDLWGEHVHVTLDSPSLRPLLAPLRTALERCLAPRAITLGWRSDPRDGSRSVPPPELLAGEAPGGDPLAIEVVVQERGLRFHVCPAAGSDAGLFPDMRECRTWLDRAWSGRRVLNLFAFTGAFSVFAASRGAREVLTADLSPQAIERARANFALNGLDPCAWGFEREETFRLLDRLRRKEQRFDLVLADPPPFSHGPGGAFAVERDLPRLAAACLRVLAPAGLLVLCCNQGTVAPRAFQKAVEQGALKAGQRLHLVHGGGQAPDYPAAVHFPEGRYLKVGVWACSPGGG